MKKAARAGYAATALFLALLMLALTPLTALASDPLTNHIEGWPKMDDISELTAVVIDADNGAVLYSLDKDVQRHPASITKIMTCLLVLENASMDEEVTIGQEALDVAIAGNANIAPVLGEVFTVEQCLYMLMLKSANDIAVQLAVHVAGSVEDFCAMMNERAAAVGCKNTYFANPNGLPNEAHHTTAYDMALIMRECLKNETFRKIIATWSYTVPATNKTAEPRTYENHNRLIDTTSEYYYSSCIGGKTGYTDLALRTLICAAERDGRTLIAVTMGGADRSDFVDIAKLFEYGFNNFSTTETTDSSGMTGSYTLPNGLPPTLTTEEGTVPGVVDYIYDGKIKVGELKNPSAAAASSGGSSGDGQSQDAEAASQGAAGETDSSQGGGTDASGGEKQGGFFSRLKKLFSGGGSDGGPVPTITLFGKHINRSVFLAALAALIAVIVLICVGVSVHLEKKRREEARRRRAARRRREERERAARRAEGSERRSQARRSQTGRSDSRRR